MRPHLALLLSLVATAACQERLPDPPPPPPVSNHGGGADPATREIRYLALGDSITQGKGSPDFATAAFPAKLAERWRAKGCKVTLKNLGVPHFTAADIVAKELPEVAAFDPTFVTLQVGSNDIAKGVSLDAFRADVKTILATARKNGARVVVLGQNEWFRAPEGRSYGGTFEKRERFDGVLFGEARRHTAESVDLRALYRQQADEKEWADDGIHPTPAAYDAMAAELARVIPAPCGG